jgi:hypothetical protein
MGSVFNLSSTCVRTEAVRPFLPYLERMTTNDDGFFFWSSILSGGGCYLDPARRTDYRLHDQNLSRRWDPASQGGPAGDWPDHAVQSHAVLLEMASASGRSDVRECLELHSAMLRLLRDVARDGTSRRREGEDLLALLRRFSIGRLPMNAGFAAMGAAQLLSPSFGRFVHARLRK